MAYFPRVPDQRADLGLGTEPVAGSTGDVTIVGYPDDSSVLQLGPGTNHVTGTFVGELTTSTGAVEIVGNADDTSELTLGSGASSVSGTNTGDQNLSTIEAATVFATTAPAAIDAGVNNIELAHGTVAIEKTIASLANHQGLMVIKNTSADGTAAHKITVTTGTWDGTNKVITLNAPKECLVVFIDSAGNGTILVNVGTVGLG